jgi:hypothetical protein
VSDLAGHLAKEVDWARRKLANAEERRDLNTEGARLHWDLVNTFGLSAPAAARAIRERLLAEGFTEAQMRGLGVSEHSIKPIAGLRDKP